MCSTALTTTPSRPSAARAAPSTARLSASVPPPVNTTSPGSAPRADATTSRAPSSAVLAARAAPWMPDGFAKHSERYGAIAATASGRIGVLAAWSRYVTAVECTGRPSTARRGVVRHIPECLSHPPAILLM